MIEIKKDTRVQKGIQRIVYNIKELIETFDKVKGSPESEEYRKAKNAIRKSKYVVEIRSAWHSPHAHLEPYEYRFGISKRGFPVRLYGLLDELNDPYTARLEYLDKDESWKEYGDITVEDKKNLVEYANIV